MTHPLSHNGFIKEAGEFGLIEKKFQVHYIPQQNVSLFGHWMPPKDKNEFANYFSVNMTSAYFCSTGLEKVKKSGH